MGAEAMTLDEYAKQLRKAFYDGTRGTENYPDCDLSPWEQCGQDHKDGWRAVAMKALELVPWVVTP